MSGERLELAARGAWTVEHASALEPLVDAASARRHKVSRVSIDMGRIDRLDTFGAWLVERLLRAWRSAGLEATVVGLGDQYRGLLQHVQHVNRHESPAGSSHSRTARLLENVGRAGSASAGELGSMKMGGGIDALRTMGFGPVDVLVLPRLIALGIALPILTFLGSMAALYGGALVCWLYGGISPEIFVSRLKD